MKTAPLKYNIKNRMSKISKGDHKKVLAKIFVAILPYSDNSFYRWRKLKQDEKTQIPYTCLVAIANQLGCSPDDLINPVKQPQKA